MPAKLFSIQELLAAGINPAALGIKKSIIGAYSSNSEDLKANLKRMLRLQDEQDALNRFSWYNLPPGLNGNLIERILYYKGQAMLFFMKSSGKFYFLPYALDGTIDLYGRYLEITPVPFAGGKTDADGKTMPWIKDLKRKVIYEVQTDEDFEDANDWINKIDEYTVILSDYSRQLNDNVVPRSILQDCLIDTMAETIPFMRTNLIASSGVAAMRVNTEDEQSNVEAASQGVLKAALTGKKWIPVVGNLDFQDLSTSEVAKAEEYFMAYQSLDNLRLSNYGLGGGVFNKLGTTLQSEADLNSINTQLILQDALYQRQEFCNIVNSIFGTSIWCDLSSSVQLADTPNENQADAMDEEEDSQGGEESTGGDESNDEQQ